MTETAQDGAIVFDLLAAGVLTLIVGIAALVLLQRAIVRNMTAHGLPRPIEAPPQVERERRHAAAALTLAVDASTAEASSAYREILRRMAIAHIVSGLVFAALATVILLRTSGIELLPLRTAVVIWAYAWPTALVLTLLTGPDRRAQGIILIGYLGVLCLLCTLTWLAGVTPLVVAGVVWPGIFQPLLLWAIYALPSLFLLLFLNRTIRAIGPLVLVFVFVLMLGTHVALTFLAVPRVADVAVTAAVATGFGGSTLFWSIIALGALLAAWPAWLAVKFLRDRYAAKRSSELMLTISAVWMLQSLMLGLSLYREQGLLIATAALVPLFGWRLALHFGLRPLVAAGRTRQPATLLLLRVYGFGRRSRHLFDLLASRWRLLGSIDLIAAPDLASRTIEPSTFLEFIRGRLSRLFIHTPEDLHERLAAIDRRPDPDGRFRVNQLFCSDDMWKESVTRLMGAATLVVMDLRGFSSQRGGCVYEIQTLLDTVPLQRLVFLFDRSTDRDALKTVLADRWRQLDVASPNFSNEKPILRLLDANQCDVKAVGRTLGDRRAASLLAGVRCRPSGLGVISFASRGMPGWKDRMTRPLIHREFNTVLGTAAAGSLLV